jgi:hypothetical protein
MASDDVPRFEQALKQLGNNVAAKIYDDAGPAFENPNNKEGCCAAMRRMLGPAWIFSQ